LLSKLKKKLKKIYKKFISIDIRYILLYNVQKILKNLIDGKPDREIAHNQIEEKENLSQREINMKLTDRQKLERIEESLRSMQKKYHVYKTGRVDPSKPKVYDHTVFTRKDVGEMVEKDIQRVLDFMREMEETQ
jgi:predicted MPP superfamily phosphohydrolase